MITKYLLFLEEVELTQGNTSGKAGDGAPIGGGPSGQAYQRSGGLNGEFGNSFTPKAPSKNGTYKNKKIKKKRFIKNIKIK